MVDERGTPIELGRGAMGITYKAFDVDLRCPVTLKVINERYVGEESARRRFLREARAAASLHHTNVASVFHLGRSGPDYFYAMEFVEGETLESLIKRSGRLDTKLALEITTQVASGLAAVHKEKLVHRDIKPTNIMVRLEEGGAVTAKIIDLGLAKATVHEAGSPTAISALGGFAGTPEFASPEQFAGVAVDIRSDLYSLGVTQRNPVEVERLASELVELLARYNFAFWLPGANVFRGWTRSVRGDTSEGISWIERGVEDYRASGSMVGMPLWLVQCFRDFQSGILKATSIKIALERGILSYRDRFEIN